MNTIKQVIDYIVPQTLELNKKHIPGEKVEITYSAIFCQNQAEYDSLLVEAEQLGRVVDNTPTGHLFQLDQPLSTLAGQLNLVKIRKPDPIRPERDDADFTLENYQSFKNRHQDETGHFKLIVRDNFEMIELRDPEFDVLSYFSDPPVTAQFGIE